MDDKPRTRSVTVRLPDFIVDALDDEVEARQSNRTDIIRRAVILYQRARYGVFVPLAGDDKQRLLAVAKTQRVPYERLLTSWVEERIAEECLTTDFASVAEPSIIQFSPRPSDQDDTSWTVQYG